MPNHYYGYEPEKEAGITFGSGDVVLDNVYKKPLEDMPTNPSSPLYQAMDNQRGPTYNQMLKYEEDDAETFAGRVENKISETPLGQAMNNVGNQFSGTMNQDEMLAGTVDTPKPTGTPEEVTAGEVDLGDENTGGGREEITAGTVDNVEEDNVTPTGPSVSAPGNPYDEDDLGDTTGGTDSGPDKSGTVMTDKDSYVPLPSDPTNPANPLNGSGGSTAGGGNTSTGSGNTGGSTSGSQSNFRGSMLEQALSDYNVDELQEQFGNVFDEYDPTRQGFVEQRGAFDTGRLNLQRDEANIGAERQRGQLGRQSDLLQDQLGLNVNLDALRQEQMGLQRSALEARQGDINEDYAMRQQMFGLQEEQQAQALDTARSGARNQLMGLYGQSEVTGGFAGSGARDMTRQRAIDSFTDNASGRISSLADTRRIGLAKQQATQQRDRQLRGLGSQLSGLDIADKQRQFQFDSQQGRVSSQLEGIQSELGDNGFLQRSLDNRMRNIDVTGRMQELGREESIFGLKEDYRKDVRGRLIDIIRGGGDLSPYKLTTQEKLDRGLNTVTQYGSGSSSMAAYNTGYGGDSRRT